MEVSEIYLNRLLNSDELYGEVAEKLGVAGISGKDELAAALAAQGNGREYRIFVSDEGVPNSAVDEISEVFRSSGSRCSFTTDEFLNLIDEHSRLTRSAKPRSLVHRDGDLHPTVHIWLIKRRDMGIFVLLQKRAPGKDVNPGKYDVSAAGHVSQGGEFRHAAVRELKEELGIETTGERLELIGLLNNVEKYGSINDNELSAVYLCREEIDADNLDLQESEVSEVCWAEIDEMLSVMKNGGFPPNCISLKELDMIKKAVF